MTHRDLSQLSTADLNFKVAQSKKCLSEHRINSTIFATPHGDEWNNSTIISEISKYYNFADNGFEPLMFLHCDGYKAIDSTDTILFDQEMKYLHDNGFKVIPMSDIGYNENTKFMYIK